MKCKMDDEIKRAGLQSFVPEELEKHLILNSNRLRTFEDVRSEVVKYVEEKFGLRIRVFKQSAVSFFVQTRIPLIWMLSALLSALLSGKGKWSSDLRGKCFKGDTAHFQRNRNAIKNRQSEQVMVHE